MQTIIDKDEDYQEVDGRKVLLTGLKVLAVVGIGAGLYGFKIGRQMGFRKGVDVGYILAGKDMIDALQEHAKELKLSRKQIV